MNEPLRLPGSLSSPGSLDEQLIAFEEQLDSLPAVLFRHIPLGIPWLDKAFGGGLVDDDMMFVAGKQNVGKTTILLQFARYIAMWAVKGKHPIAPLCVSYEHDEWDLFSRLLCLESFYQDREKPLEYWQISQSIYEIKREQERAGKAVIPTDKAFLDLLFARLPEVASAALHAISAYAPKLMLYHGDRTYLTVTVIEQILDYFETHRKLFLLPMIDYLQTVPPPLVLIDRAITDRDVINLSNINLLKDLAVRRHVPVIAVAAVDDEALKKNRPVHIEDIFGPVEAQYSPDRALIINPDITWLEEEMSEARITNVRLSLEKNRKGPSELEYRHIRQGGSFLIETDGEKVLLAESFQQARSRTEISSHNGVWQSIGK